MKKQIGIEDGPVPYDMNNPDVRYMAEKFTTKKPYNYIYLWMYRFTMISCERGCVNTPRYEHLESEVGTSQHCAMNLSESGWRIDMVHHKGGHDTHWGRDYYF